MAGRKYNEQTKCYYSFNLKLFGQNGIESHSVFRIQILFSIQYSVIRVSLILIHWLQTGNVANSAIAWSMCLQDWLHYSSELNQDKRISFKVNLRQKSCILRYQDLWKPRQGKVWSHNLMEAFCDRYATMVSLPWVDMGWVHTSQRSGRVQG